MTLVRRPWSEQDLGELKEMAGKLAPKDLARRLKRTESATRVRAWKLGLSVASAEAMDAAPRAAPGTQTIPDVVEKAIAPAAIERALAVYQQLQPRDQSVILQARKILTQHIYAMVDRGEQDEQRLTVSGLVHLKAVERDHGIKSAHGAEASSPVVT
jgi:hypothetical protein